MWLKDYLEAMGLDHYDFEEFGAKNFKEICEQQYPVYGRQDDHPAKVSSE